MGKPYTLKKPTEQTNKKITKKDTQPKKKPKPELLTHKNISWDALSEETLRSPTWMASDSESYNVTFAVKKWAKKACFLKV